MRKARKVHVVAALTAALCAWLLASAGAAVAAQDKIAWAKCHGGPFECGTLQVPLDYDHPNGSKIALGLTRLPATDPVRFPDDRALLDATLAARERYLKTGAC